MDVNDRQRLVRIEDKLDVHLEKVAKLETKSELHFWLICSIWVVIFSGIGIVAASML